MATNYVTSGETSDSPVVSSGNTLIAQQGSIVSNAEIKSGGTFIVSSGGTSWNTSTSNGGTAIIYGSEFLSGNTGRNIIIGSSGNFVVFGGATAYNTVTASGGTTWITQSNNESSDDDNISYYDHVERGGTFVVASDAEAYYTEINGIAFSDRGGTIISANINSGGSLQIGKQTKGTGKNLTINGGGELYLGDKSKSYNVDIKAHAKAIAASGAYLSTTIIESGSDKSFGGQLVVYRGASISDTSVGWRGQIDVEDVQYQEGEKVAFEGGTLTVTDRSGNSLWSTVLKGDYQAEDFHVEAAEDGSSLVTYDKCFLSGTLIRCPGGNRAVETIGRGDEVLAWDWGNEREIIHTVTWVGYRIATVRPELPDDMAGYPVRICRNAIADNVPDKDLLVTAEHVLFFNGFFVPARMLVNGASIFYDKSFSSYKYYHVETSEHCILWADNVLTESYLDTGDRQVFTQDGTVVSLVNQAPLSWTGDAAAPLNVQRDFVEPLYRHFEARAMRMGLQGLCPPEITTEPELMVVDDKGNALKRLRETNGFVLWQVPGAVRRIRLLSRSSRPCDAVGPFVDDRRCLGVLVGSIRLCDADHTQDINVHLTEAGLPGWQALENGRAMRWTDGEATLPLGNTRPWYSSSLLAIQIIATGPYIKQKKECTLLPEKMI